MIWRSNNPFPGLLHNHTYENEFNLHVNKNSFSYERMGNKRRNRLKVVSNWPIDISKFLRVLNELVIAT